MSLLTKAKKTYDKLLLKEHRKDKPREYFKFINKFLSRSIKIATPKLLDVACATGDFLYYMSTLYPKAELSGIDISHDFIARAKKEVPSAKFSVGDIIDGKGLPRKQFDYVFMSGAHSDFDEYRPWINNLLKLTKKGGKLFVFGLFNFYEIDTVMRTRFAKKDSLWQPGWNLISKKTVGDYLESKKIKYEFHDFHIGIDIEKRKDAPLRSWTVKLKDGTRIVTSGTGIVHYSSLLIITK